VSGRLGTVATSGVLAALAGLHVAWGRGSTFPFATRKALNGTVIGGDKTPPPAACYSVAALLAAASALVAGLPTRRSWMRRAGVCTVATALGGRAALGFAGKTDVVSPGSTSARFRRIDRCYYSPLCLTLALGALNSLRRPAD
jgi:hypothetical protein